MRLSILLSLFLMNCAAQGAELRESFSTRDRLLSQTAVWNHALGAIHPTLNISYTTDPLGANTPASVAVALGDGSHGSFDPTTYARFSRNGDVSGNIIRLDTSVYPILNVTSFDLAAGWTLIPIGNSPLKIYSLSDVFIRGEIWCQGEDGANAVAGTRGLGGAGRCGGKNGGDGGIPNGPGADGDDSLTGTVDGGVGGNANATGVGGGGGGSWNSDGVAFAGPNASGSGGGPGATQNDPEFTTIAGGSGGGGGGGTPTDAGAGGGGGGGVVIIHAARDFELGTSPVSSTGFIYANGGRGGNSNVDGGPGGGGGGGAVQVFAGRNLRIYNNDADGASQATPGEGGSNTSFVVGTATGGQGRSWFSAVSYSDCGVCYYSPGEEISIDPGVAEFSNATEEVVLGVFDLRNTRPQINSVTTNPVASDFALEFAGSNDEFVTDDTGFSSSLSSIRDKRYIKVRLKITTTNVNAPTMVDDLIIDYTPTEREDFSFSTAGCGRVNQPTRSPPMGFFVGLLFFLVGGLVLKLKAQREIRRTCR